MAVITHTVTLAHAKDALQPGNVIHLASLGHPLVGGPLYGFTSQPLENLPGLPGDGGYFLHAQYLEFHQDSDEAGSIRPHRVVIRLTGRIIEMQKGFTRRPKADEPATQGKNYITPSGLQRLHDEHRFLLSRERPAVTAVVAWAASNGDRSENADYQYGKRRLRQIDGRIRFLRKRIEAAEVVDPEAPRTGKAATRAFFGATVRYTNAAGVERVVSIVGTDEVDLDRNHISWVSPLGRALLKSEAGDSVELLAPGGTEYLDVLEVRYERIAVEPFREPLGSESSSKDSRRRDSK